MALAMTEWRQEDVSAFCNHILKSASTINLCHTCGCFISGEDPNDCHNCQSRARLTADSTASGSLSICVVEKPTDVLNIEKFRPFDGVFHVLGGKVSPAAGVDPEDLRIESLIEYTQKIRGAEVILALSSDVESEATIHYLKDRLSSIPGLRITRLARGLPAGSTLEHTDELTLLQSMENRIEL